MNRNFIKKIYIPVVKQSKTDVSAIESFIVPGEKEFILKHNLPAVSALLRFLESPDNIFILNGVQGSGKTDVINFITGFIDENVLIFKNSYKEAVNLDDIFLSMFKDFSTYRNEKKIILPKTETNVFSEKINLLVKNCDLPMLFIFDSFEINSASKDSQKDISDFLNYLSKYAKIKIIIGSRSFRQEDLPSFDGSVSYTLTPINKEDIINYLKNRGITGNDYEIENFYKLTEGKYLLCEFSSYIMNTSGISLPLFISEYKKSSKSFRDFVISKILSFTAEKYMKPLVFLSVLRHGITGELLESVGEVSKDDIKFLMQKHVISEEFGKYYLKDYIKSEFKKTVNNETLIEMHKYAAELYESELPLKPFERKLFLSRLTMRQEISRHTKKITLLEEDEKRSGKMLDGQKLSYLGFIKAGGFDIKDPPKKKKYLEKLKNKKTRDKRYDLSEEDTLLLNSGKIRDEAEKKLYEIAEAEQQTSIEKQDIETVPDSMNEFISIAQNYEDSFNFTGAITYYNRALTYTDDNEYEIKKPVIYTKLAICYRKIQNADEAIKLYHKIYAVYSGISPDKACDALLSIAEIYNDSYKFDKSKEIYSEIINHETDISDKMKVKVYINLSETESNNTNPVSALKYMKTALSFAEKLPDTKLLAQCCFKYALAADDTDDTASAALYYKKCIQLSDNPEENPYLSAAYSNLAEICLETDDKRSAEKYFESAVQIDQQTGNCEGLFYSYSKLADIYKDKNTDKSYEFLLKALSAAKRFDDTSYSVAIYSEIGSLYQKRKNYKKALKSYILAKKLINSNSPDDLLDNINKEISKIKKHTGEIEFIRIMNTIKKKP